ncbi:hypothetical protein K493DRAFT_311906 [Basidiobolus meristosporus CBS 931.73]|uniref:PH domain-containing protein n=1 Tax=Basidiobolus meristosporus CBS 931.73 TaxID=1314790 RepID=A0A1Y1YYC1_9FUNG|nr:hypothetical protein K493DRAFT_311906 [Basidiobolus meristosporus CBS 931.73]|eukprot:ORY03022.1 hypothetical protein K493DRAFT_311906 [Basidiobolus meristosporus CBS 931.73]
MTSILPSCANPDLYCNNHGEPISDFTLELEKMRNCLGKISLQRRTFERRGSVDSVGTGLSGLEDNSDAEENELTKRRTLPTNVSFLLRELDECLENLQKRREYGTKKGGDKAASKTKAAKEEIEAKTRNLWPSQESIAKVSARFATSFKSAIADSTATTTTSPPPPPPQKIPSYVQRQPVTLSEVYIAALWAGWVSKLYISNPLFVTRKTWKRRFFVLTPKALYRFKSSAPSAASLEPIEISAKTEANVSEKFPARRFVIEINNAGRPTCYIQVESLEELKIWLSSIKSAIIQNKYPGQQSALKSSRDSTATSSTTSSSSSSNRNRSVPRLAEMNFSQIPAPAPMPKYPPPPVPHTLHRVPSYSTPAEPFRPALQRVKTLPAKGNHNSTTKLLLIESNPTQLIDTIPRNNLTFSAVEATH